MNVAVVENIIAVFACVVVVLVVVVVVDKQQTPNRTSSDLYLQLYCKRIHKRHLITTSPSRCEANELVRVKEQEIQTNKQTFTMTTRFCVFRASSVHYILSILFISPPEPCFFCVLFVASFFVLLFWFLFICSELFCLFELENLSKKKAIWIVHLRDWRFVTIGTFSADYKTHFFFVKFFVYNWI